MNVTEQKYSVLLSILLLVVVFSSNELNTYLAMVIDT